MESIRVLYKVQAAVDDTGLIRNYEFTHPYGAPAEEAFHALDSIRSQIEMRVAEIQNSQLQSQGQVPEIKDVEGLTHGN